MKNQRKWGSPEKQADKPKTTSHPLSLNFAPEVKTPTPYTSLPRRERRSKISSADKNAMTPRRSTRKHTPSEATRNKEDPSDEDVILSLNDEKYKEIMWRHYNILGKKQPGDKSREEDVGNQIFISLKKSLGRGGRFFKKMSHGDIVFVVDDVGALQSECLFPHTFYCRTD